MIDNLEYLTDKLLKSSKKHTLIPLSHVHFNHGHDGGNWWGDVFDY